MLYEKLPVVLISTLAAMSDDETNSVIASYVLRHADEVKTMGIKELAAKTHVGVGSISRFCKAIGLNDFAELKILLNETTYHFQEADREHLRESITRQIHAAIDLAGESVDMTQVAKLAEEIKRYPRVMAFGLLKAQNAAYDLVVDLFMQHKEVKTTFAYAKQLNMMMNTDEDDLIIIFSYTGSYFDYKELRVQEKKLKKPRIWMICGGEKPAPWFVDEVIRFSSLLDQRSHPYQLEYIESLIASRYQMLMKEEL